MRASPPIERAGALFALVVAVAAPRAALAYRPFLSTDAGVADEGEIEVELGYVGFRRDRSRDAIVTPALVVNVGVAHGVEVVGQFKLVTDLGPGRGRDATRFDDSELSVKWVLHEGVLQDAGPSPSLALELSALLPTVHGEDRPGGELVAILSGRTGGFTYHVNAGGLVEPGGDEPGVVWGVIAERPLYGALRAVAEIDGESVRGAEPDNTALVGAVWSVPGPAPFHELSFDVGIRRGLSNGADDWGGTAGLTFAFPFDFATRQEVTP
jgi:hypothetical protein